MTEQKSKTVVLVSCVKTKETFSCRAEDLYISALFRKASAYARMIGDEWYILSAQYGLVRPGQIISPYELTLNRMSVYDRQAWARLVLTELKKILKRGDTVVFTAGVRYREGLIRQIYRMGCMVEIPMEGLSFGNQLKWLGEQTEA